MFCRYSRRYVTVLSDYSSCPNQDTVFYLPMQQNQPVSYNQAHILNKLKSLVRATSEHVTPTAPSVGAYLRHVGEEIKMCLLIQACVTQIVFGRMVILLHIFLTWIIQNFISIGRSFILHTNMLLFDFRQIYWQWHELFFEVKRLHWQVNTFRVAGKQTKEITKVTDVFSFKNKLLDFNRRDQCDSRSYQVRNSSAGTSLVQQIDEKTSLLKVSLLLAKRGDDAKSLPRLNLLQFLTFK